jgi:SAM-dependent MidA family methyltransferase
MTRDPTLPAPSSLLSSRWSRDNLVTMRPGRLYDGRVLERVEPETLEYLVQDLERELGPLRVGAGNMGVLTWDIACESASGPFVLQVPRVLDERGSRERAVREVPRENVENMRDFRRRGLSRFVAEPRALTMLGGGVPAALFDALPGHRSVTFGQGAIQVELNEGTRTWFVALGARATAEVLAELVAALVYHYEPELDGGTAVADVCVNDGDFALRRRHDGSFDLRLRAVRKRETNIEPSLLILYLVQLLAYEDFTIDESLIGLPTLMSNPSVAFAGVVRGLRYRERDLGGDPQQGENRALAWIRDFGRSRDGRAYRPWVERFVAGDLPLSFGEDLRERWWRTIPLDTKLGLLELSARQSGQANDVAAARSLRSFLERLAREMGPRPEAPADLFRVNDAALDALDAALADAQVPSEARAHVAARFFEQWPYRNLDHLLGLVPEARSLRRVKSRLVFGEVTPEEEHGTLRGAASPGERTDVPRRIANHEVFASWSLAPEQVADALATFPTFEAYMDATLHDPRWGYYARNVVIGKGGHFETHPEEFSPHYGRWVALAAFKAWRELVEHGELDEDASFPIVEFGAGNGRLARDVLDAVAARAASADSRDWSLFAQRAQYRIYEMSETLRERQRTLLGEAVTIAAGDARRPGASLARDFPDGLRGFVVTNELPDAFGVHKVILSVEGEAAAALVVPRLELPVCNALPSELARRVSDGDRAVRARFGLVQHPDARYLEHDVFSAVLAAIAALPPERRDAAHSALWFEEVYVPAARLPELAALLAENAADYATALAAGDSGVVLYVNVHAARFMRELGASLRAGFVVTIDYGDTTFGLVRGARRGDFPFRVYRDAPDYRPRPNDPYAAPGSQDMTADVNFGELARAGEGAGLSVVHYGPERDLAGDELPELVRRAADEPAFAKFLGNPVFKMLVLGTRGSSAFSGPLASPLPLASRERDVPKAQRAKIAAIERALSNLSPERAGALGPPGGVTGS